MIAAGEHLSFNLLLSSYVSSFSLKSISVRNPPVDSLIFFKENITIALELTGKNGKIPDQSACHRKLI